MIRSAFIASALLLAASPALAAEEDVQVWNSVSATIDLSKTVVLSLDAQVRWSEDSSRFGQAVVRPGIGIKLDPNTTATLGYAYAPTDPVGPRYLHEHRIWQQLTYRLAGDGKGITLTGRSRLEQRFVEGQNGTGLRFRQQLRMATPLAGKVRAFVWAEPFIAFNDTPWGQNSGLERLRTSAGVTVPLTGSFNVEPAYINQWVIRPARDRVDHIANLILVGKF